MKTSLRLRPVLRAASFAAALAAFAPTSASAQPATLKVFTNATAEGSAPVAPLAIRADGVLFGATNSGGANGLGTLFRLNADGTGFTVLKQLDSTGTGYFPNGGMLVGADGRLYGTMNYGGPTGRGSLFAMNTDGTGFTVLRYFAGADGTYPTAGLTQGSDGMLYGATTLDGAATWGTIFRVNPDGSGFAVLHNFANDAGGGQPQGTPVFGSDGALYGTTYRGGAFGNGTVFKMNADGTGFTVLHHFAGAPDGAQAYTGVTASADGKIYGTTNFDGSNGGGTLYRLNLDGTGYAVLLNLGAATAAGNGPFYCVPALSGGRLYATAGFNGTSGGAGSVFSLNPDGTGFAVELGFSGTGKPLSGVRAGPDGRLYGTTREGGAGGLGTIFRVGAPPPSPVPSFQGVGDLPGGIFFSEVRDATRVNGVLIAVGGSAANSNSTGADTAFRWTSSGGMAALPNIVTNTTGTNFMTASAITRDGAVIASRARNVAAGGRRVAVLVTNQGTTNTVLGYLPGNTNYSVANAVSNDGSIAYGFSRINDATGAHQAFRWTATTGLVAVPFLAPGDLANFPAGRGTSADGVVMVGTSGTVGSLGAGNRAYVYVHGLGVAPLPLLTGGTWNAALAVTSDGGTSLGVGDSTVRPNGELVRWAAAATPLGSPDASMSPSNFGGLADDGTAVLSFAPASGPDTAYLRNSHGWSTLVSALSAAGLNLAGWSLDVVFGISPDGTLVFGRGTHNGNQEGWVAELAPGYLATYYTDHTAPVLTLPANLTLEAASPAGATASFAATALDETDGGVPVTYSTPPGSTFPLGTSTVTVTATDTAGNTATGSFTVTVVDTTAPTISAPANITAEATSAAGAIVNFAASASDLVSGAVAVSASPAAGATFGLGTTMVSLTATDAAGNTATASFNVTVVDTTAPTITSLSTNAPTLWPPNHKMVAVTVSATASDLVGVTSLKIVGVTSNEPDNGLGDGDTAGDIEITGALTVNLRAERSGTGTGRVYTITVEARDAAGNATTKTVAVTVPKNQSGK